MSKRCRWNVKQCRPWSDWRSSLIWVYTVCQDLSFWWHLGTLQYELQLDKTNKMTAPSEDYDQPGHPPSLSRVFAVRAMGYRGPKPSSCGQWRLWSDWVDAQADLKSSLGQHAILMVLSLGGTYNFSLNLWLGWAVVWMFNNSTPLSLLKVTLSGILGLLHKKYFSVCTF